MKNKLIIALVCAITITLFSGSVVTYAEGKGDGSPVTGEEGGESGSGNNGGGNIVVPPANNIQSKKVIISSVTTDTENIEPGKPFTITYRVENISDGKIDGLSLKLTNLEGKSTLEGFTPVGTTNEIYVGSIGYNDIRDVSITLISNPNTKTGNYNFQTSVMFSQGGGAQEEITKISGVMLKTTPDLELSSVESMGTNVMGTLINDGSAKIKKVNVKVKVGDKEYEQKINSVDSESEEFFEVFVEPSEVEQDAIIEVTYEDISGGKYKTEGTCKIYPMIIEEEPADKKGKVDKKSKAGLVGLIMSFFKIGA